MEEIKSQFQDELKSRYNRMNNRTRKAYKKNVEICQKVFETLTYNEVFLIAVLRELPRQCVFHIRENIEKTYTKWVEHVEAVREVDCSEHIELYFRE